MQPVVHDLLECAAPGLTWIAVAGSGVAGVFVVYIGLAVGVALFHPDEPTRRHAASVLRQLLQVFAGRSTR